MKILISLLFVLLTVIGCNSSKNITSNEVNTKVSDTVKIANEELEYEVIIIDPGFSSWIAGRALPRGYYSEAYLENKNQIYVTEWNNRVAQPMQYDNNLYLFRIDYDLNVRYGYEVNYLIYNYFIYFQNQYNQRLGGFVPKQ